MFVYIKFVIKGHLLCVPLNTLFAILSQFEVEGSIWKWVEQERGCLLCRLCSPRPIVTSSYSNLNNVHLPQWVVCVGCRQIYKLSINDTYVHVLFHQIDYENRRLATLPEYILVIIQFSLIIISTDLLPKMQNLNL